VGTPLRAPTKLAFLVGSLAVSLAAAEQVASALHRGAFPYLNLFVADARFGVRLAPRARTRVRSRQGRVTDIATNGLGFRGDDWAGGAGPRVLLLGDSQAFGYGIDQADSIAARLEHELGGGARVLAAAVPSWGPSEYVRALADLAPTLRPTHVVFVANAANDWFELSTTNAERTTARDGFAARFVPGAPAPRAFPGRVWLLGRSHLVLAARQLAGHLGGGELPPTDAARLLRAEGARRRPGAPSPMLAPLAAAAALCRAPACRLVAAALPLDVQVDRREWPKYRAEPIELGPSLALLADFVDGARAAGVPAVDLAPTLRAAEPGAFLPDDYHLSPRGARAVAAAVAHQIRETYAQVTR
jgi:hypothetical protein